METLLYINNYSNKILFVCADKTSSIFKKLIEYTSLNNLFIKITILTKNKFKYFGNFRWY